jgi:hypothetical protein
MRKIDKTCSLSTVYKAWEEGLEANGHSHPKYSSSAEYYRDIIMQLYLCQGGLCAYTEQLLCEPSIYSVANWAEGKYTLDFPKRKPLGSLDHFDPKLKENKGWLWDNFFMIDYEVNSTKIKGKKSVDPILKPDVEDYDPFELLEYDVSLHTFLPNGNLEKETFGKVENMINVLGINHIDERRRDLLKSILRRVFTRQISWDEAEAETRQFPTALKMCRLQLEGDDEKLKNLLFGLDNE